MLFTKFIEIVWMVSDMSVDEHTILRVPYPKGKTEPYY